MPLQPSVTAVVPTHNRPELMRKAVVSILNQDYHGPIEIIVVFDACDPVLPDLDIGPNRSVRALPNQRTRGLAGARNTGIVNASHDVVAFLDDDDEWLTGKLTRQMRLLHRHPQAIMVGSAMVIDQDGRMTVRSVPCNPIRHADLLRDRMGGLPSGSFVYRKGPLVEIGMLDEELPGSYGEDYDLLLRTARIAPIPIINEPLVRVRWSENSYFFGRWEQYAISLTYLRNKHTFASDRHAVGRIDSQIAFAHAAAGNRSDARAVARRSLRSDPRQVKAYLAILISLRLISAAVVIRTARRLGKGI